MSPPERERENFVNYIPHIRFHIRLADSRLHENANPNKGALRGACIATTLDPITTGMHTRMTNGGNTLSQDLTWDVFHHKVETLGILK